MKEFIKNLATPHSDSMFGALWDFVNFETALKFAVLYMFVIWIALVVWVIKDVTNRTSNIFLQIICILLVVLLPFMWIFLYLLVRPGNTLLEKHYSEIEENLDTMAEFIALHVQEKKTQEEEKKAIKPKPKYQTKSQKRKNKKKAENLEK